MDQLDELMTMIKTHEVVSFDIENSIAFFYMIIFIPPPPSTTFVFIEFDLLRMFKGFR